MRRQENHKSSSALALPSGSTETDPTGVLHDYAFGNPETESRARIFARRKKRLKDSVAILPMNPGAGICDRNSNSRTAAMGTLGGISQVKPEATPFRHGLDRIRNQIGE